jgi:selenide,water dikinase
VKRLVLAGGGHAHVEVLRRFALSRPAGAEVVVVTPEHESPYSGMLPGHLSGFYARDEIFIDVAGLAARCGARFVAARVAGIDASARTVALDDGTRLGYDILSLDIGSTPATGRARGVAEHALALKPIPLFLQGWQRLLLRAERGGMRRVAMVGGGAAGVEVLLSIRHRLLQAPGGDAIQWHLVTDAAELLPAHPPRVRRVFESVFAERGIIVHRSAPVASVQADALVTAGGLSLPADATLWATGASPPAFLRSTGLALDAAGFVEIDATLRSTSHPEVFAAGDVATMRGEPRPKSGVFAVRQGPPLAGNLAAALAGAPLVPYRPQREALALVTTGERYAVASRGRMMVRGAWVWRWKDWIDRRFMARYRG